MELVFLYAWIRVYSGCLSKMFINIWRGQEHRKRSVGNTLWSTWSMDLYNHRSIHNNPCTWFVRKTFLIKQWSHLGSLNIYRRFIPINLVKHWHSFIHSLRDQFLKRKTRYKFTSSSKNSDDGLKTSYNISLLIAKAGKPHTIGEELILPAVKEVIKTVLHKSPEQVIKSISLSDNSVQQRVDKMAENIKETLSKMLMTTEFSLQ